MSTTPISGNNLPFFPTALNTVDPGGQTTTTQSTSGTLQLPPISGYLSLPFARLTLASVGLPLPRTPDDVAAILAEVSDALDKVIGLSRNIQAETIAAAHRTAFAGLGVVIGTMGALQASYVAMEAERDSKKVELADKQAELTANRAKSASLQDDINVKNGQISQLNGQISDLNSGISSLNIQISDAQKSGNIAAAVVLTAQRDVLVQQRNATETVRDSTAAARDAKVSEKATVDAEGQALAQDIADLTVAINTLEASMAATSAAYLETQASMFQFFTPFTLYLSSVSIAIDMMAFQHDFGMARFMDDLAARFHGVNDRLMERFEALPYLAQVVVANTAIRASLALSLAFGGDLRFAVSVALSNQLNLFSAFNFPSPVLGVILDASLNAFERGLLRGDVGSMLLLDHLADALVTTRVLENVIARDPSINFFDKMVLLNRLQEAENSLRMAMAFGLPPDANRLADLLGIAMISPFHMPNGIMGRVVEAALDLFDNNPFNDWAAKRVLSAATGLIGGLTDVLTTLAMLDAFDLFDNQEASLSDGFRLRLAI